MLKKAPFSLKVKLHFAGGIAKTITNALSIEINEFSNRSDVRIFHRNRSLYLNITSYDINGLRSAANTYLRWIAMCEELSKD